MLQITRQGSQWTVDIHGMHAREARFRLDMLLDNAPEEVKEIVIIHGRGVLCPAFFKQRPPIAV